MNVSGRIALLCAVFGLAIGLFLAKRSVAQRSTVPKTAAVYDDESAPSIPLPDGGEIELPPVKIGLILSPAGATRADLRPDVHVSAPYSRWYFRREGGALIARTPFGKIEIRPHTALFPHVRAIRVRRRSEGNHEGD